MDNFALEALVQEIAPSLLQKRIQRIKRLGETGFALGLRSRISQFLMISLERSCPTVFLADKAASSQREASDWLLTLRKYLMGGRILNVHKEFSERKVLLEIENYRHSSSPEKLFLVLELIPAKTNALLLNENQEVLVSFYPVSTRIRKVVETSTTHTQLSWAIDRITRADFQQWVLDSGSLRGRSLARPPDGFFSLPPSSPDGGEGVKSIISTLRSKPAQAPVRLAGMSRYFVQEIFHEGLSDPESLWERFQMLLKRVRHGPYSPQLYFLKGRNQSSTKPGHATEGSTPGKQRQLFVSPFPLDCLCGLEHSELPSMNAAAAQDYWITASDALLVATQDSQISRVDALLKKKMRLLRNLRDDLGRGEGAEVYKKYADLLYAHHDRSPPGRKGLKLIDLFDPDQREIEVPLDPKLSLIQNAVRYSKLYQKARRSIPLITSRIKKTEQEIKILADERQSLAAIMLEGLRQAGSVSREGGTSLCTPFKGGIAVRRTPPTFGGTRVTQEGETSRPDKIGLPARQETTGHSKAAHDSLVRKTAKSFVSSDGLTILVGKSSKDNDTLTLKIAQSHDFWFHVADYGGSHVVLKNPQKLAAPPRQSLLEAAQLAAYFSQARNSSKVEVHYTQKKFVSKPKGSKPGLVQLRDYKSVSVKPELLLPHPD